MILTTKSRGKPKYCADLQPEGLLYARTLRSTVPRAKILSIAVPELPEGYFVVDHRDIPGRISFRSSTRTSLSSQRTASITSDSRSCWWSVPTKEFILEILASIEVSYEAQHPIFSIEEAVVREGDFIFKSGDKPYFVAYSYTKGNPEEAIRQAQSVVEDEFRTGYQEQAYIEPQAMMAIYEDERVTVSGSMQCPYYIHDALKMALAWGDDRIRVVQLPTGGGFGGKEEYPSIPGVHAALAAIKTGKPVQLVFDRQEDIIASTKRHPSIITIKSYLDGENRIIARDVDVKTDAGAYAGLSSIVLQRMIFSVCGVYNVENLMVSGKAYATNNIVTGAFRGYGGPQAFFAIEMHMEHIASVLHSDPLELRKQYFLKKGRFHQPEGRCSMKSNSLKSQRPSKKDPLTTKSASDLRVKGKG